MANKNNPPDETQEIIAKMLAENEKAAQAVIHGAQKERDRAAADKMAALARLESTKSDKEKLSEAWYNQTLEKLTNEIQDQEKEVLAAVLLEKGETITEVAALLDLPDVLMKEIADRLRIQLIVQHQARITYEDQGRSGYVILHWDKIVNKFVWEFGGNNALVVIDIPTIALWEQQTGLPLDKRKVILAFIGQQVTRDQADGHQFRIDENAIVILR